MVNTFTHQFDTPVYKGTATIKTGLFIGGEWVDPVEGGEISVVNPATGEVITNVSGGTKADVDKAVEAARKAYKTSWGLKAPARLRAQLLNKLADLIEANSDEFAALETLNIGKPYPFAKMVDVASTIEVLRYYAGWADKIQGETVEPASPSHLNYSRREPFGVCGQIIPWNFPLMMLGVKVAPALATGNTIVLKPSEITPLTALRFADLVNEAGFPPGVVNIIVGYGQTVGDAISHHMGIDKVAFTGSTLTGRKVLKAAADSNLKPVTLELGGKSPTIIFEDAKLEEAIASAAQGIFFNMGQVCVAGSRIFVQESVYDKVVEGLAAAAQSLSKSTGDPFSPNTQHGPQASQMQYDRILSYINSGKKDGANVLVGGGATRGEKGFFIEPTVFTDVTGDMIIAKEEIFGPVASVIKFKTEEEVIELANDTVYGLACYVFSNVGRAIRVAHALEAGTAGVNTTQTIHFGLPFGGYKQSGIGRELGHYGLETYTQVKGVHVNLGN